MDRSYSSLRPTPVWEISSKFYMLIRRNTGQTRIANERRTSWSVMVLGAFLPCLPFHFSSSIFTELLPLQFLHQVWGTGVVIPLQGIWLVEAVSILFRFAFVRFAHRLGWCGAVTSAPPDFGDRPLPEWSEAPWHTGDYFLHITASVFWHIMPILGDFQQSLSNHIHNT